MTDVFAHRGAHALVRENTLEAFRAAEELGVDGVELDVRRTRDGALVIHHDPVVAERPLAELALYELPDYVPTLSAALDALRGVQVNVEIKNSPGAHEPPYDSGDLASQVLDVVGECGALDRVIFSCFDLATCGRLREATATPVAWLLWDVTISEALARAGDLGLDAVNPHFLLVDEAGVAAAKERSMALNAWTVNTEHDLLAMRDYGVTSVITDEPALALKLYGKATT